MRDAIIFDALRTPRGRGKENGALHGVKALDLLAVLFQALQSRHDLDTSQVDDILLGCVTPIGEQGADIDIHPPGGAKGIQGHRGNAQVPGLSAPGS